MPLPTDGPLFIFPCLPSVNWEKHQSWHVQKNNAYIKYQTFFFQWEAAIYKKENNLATLLPTRNSTNKQLPPPCPSTPAPNDWYETGSSLYQPVRKLGRKDVFLVYLSKFGGRVKLSGQMATASLSLTGFLFCIHPSFFLFVLSFRPVILCSWSG